MRSGVFLLNHVCLQVAEHFRITRTVERGPLTAVKMDSNSDYEPFGGSSSADILDTNSDIDELSDSGSDSDSNVNVFGSDSDDVQVVWTDVLGDVNPLPLRESVGPRHSLTEDAQAIDLFHAHLIFVSEKGSLVTTL